MPSINAEARSLSDLINWKTEEISEPTFTCLKKKDITQLFDNPIIVSNFPVHGQSIEPIVKKVTRPSMVGHKAEKRDSIIRATMAHRELMPACQSKKHLIIL